MSELVSRTVGTALSIAEDQAAFTEMQIAGLRHMGLRNATDGDLAIFFHVAKRTGLDPFARQIYMIERAGKQTIQTGIDGYRLIGRRAADRAGESISVSAPEWAHEDGTWRAVWSRAWNLPVGARVTIHRAGQPFTAVALFDEYRQDTRDGSLTRMWAQRPAGQIAKCAEALAWRLAFPQDLSGLYTDDEMHQADVPPPASQAPRAGRDAVRDALHGPSPEPRPDYGTSDDMGVMVGLMRDAGLVEAGPMLAYASETVGRELGSARDLTPDEVAQIIAALQAEIAGADVVDAEIVDDAEEVAQ